MGLVFLIVVGGTLGWLATIVMRADNPSSALRNEAVGIGGALFAGLGVSPLVARGDLLQGTYSVDALLVSLAGSALLLCAVNLFLREHESRRGAGPKSRLSVLPRGDGP